MVGLTSPLKSFFIWTFQKISSEPEPFLVGARKCKKLLSSLLPQDVFKATNYKSTLVSHPSSNYLQFAGLAVCVETQIEQNMTSRTLKTKSKKNSKQRTKERSDVRYFYYFWHFWSPPQLQKDYKFLTALTERLESQNLSTPMGYDTNYKEIISVRTTKIFTQLILFGFLSKLWHDPDPAQDLIILQNFSLND